MTGTSAETMAQGSRIIRPATAVEYLCVPVRKCGYGVLQRTDMEKAGERFEDRDFTGPCKKCGSCAVVAPLLSGCGVTEVHLKEVLIDQP